MDIISSSKIRSNIASVLNQLEQKQEPIIITQYSQPRAVLIDYQIYKKLLKELEILKGINVNKSVPGISLKNYLSERKKKLVKELRGACADLPGGSEEFMREKHEEIELEEKRFEDRKN